MPVTRQRQLGKRGEDQWTADLVALLNNNHQLDAHAFPIYHFREGAARVQCKPDFVLSKGGVCAGSAKLGQHLELKAFASAAEYQVKLPRTEELRGVLLHETFAVTYPRENSSDLFRLHILPRAGRLHEVSLSSPSLPGLADLIAAVARGEIASVAPQAEPTSAEANRLLTRAAFELSETIKRVPLGALEGIFGGHSFFQSIFASKKELKGEKKATTLRLGAAFLFVNQILFYVLLSRAAADSGLSSKYPAIKEEDMGSPRRLEENYFDRVRAVNYEPIYGVPVSGFFSERKAVDATHDVVLSIGALAPSIDTRDLAGQVFQGLIDPDIRKPLGAHYTNPNAADLLARTTLLSGRDRVLDPACGSGTLLVAGYRRKRELSSPGSPERVHRQILEREITGIDAMAFAAHLAAVNLALQEPLLETEHVRIAYTDSTFLTPGDSVQVTEESLPWALRQATLGEDFTSISLKPVRRRGPAQLRRGTPRPFTVEAVETVLMNPPFTSWENMSKPYRDSLKARFGWIEKRGYPDTVWWRMSQQAFFLLLADKFLVDGGRLGAVLPFTTFTGRAFEPFIHYLASRYTVNAIFVGLARASFSEDTSLTECLLVASKRPPPGGHSTLIVGTRKLPEEWSSKDIEELSQRVRAGSSGTDAFAVVKSFPQSELLPWKSSLSCLALSLHDEYENALSAWEDLAAKSGLPLIEFSTFSKDSGVTATRLASYFGSKPASYYGASGLFVLRHEELGSHNTDRLILKEASGSRVTASDRVGGKTYTFPLENVRPALRRLSFLRGFDVSRDTDFVVVKPGGSLRDALTAIYDEARADTFLARLAPKGGGGVLESFPSGSSRLCLMRRMDLSAQGTSVVSARSEEPFLVACDAFLFRGCNDQVQEKLLVLWFNSTPFLLLFLGHATFTRGTWLKLEDFILNRLVVPCINQSTPASVRREIENCYEETKGLRFESLLVQLDDNRGARARLDDAVLRLLGVSSGAERGRLGQIFRLGVKTALIALKQTMEAKGSGADEGEEGGED